MKFLKSWIKAKIHEADIEIRIVANADKTTARYVITSFVGILQIYDFEFLSREHIFLQQARHVDPFIRKAVGSQFTFTYCIFFNSNVGNNASKYEIIYRKGKSNEKLNWIGIEINQISSLSCINSWSLIAFGQILIMQFWTLSFCQ